MSRYGGWKYEHVVRHIRPLDSSMPSKELNLRYILCYLFCLVLSNDFPQHTKLDEVWSRFDNDGLQKASTPTTVVTPRRYSSTMMQYAICCFPGILPGLIRIHPAT